jgi:hypothetical protein
VGGDRIAEREQGDEGYVAPLEPCRSHDVGGQERSHGAERVREDLDRPALYPLLLVLAAQHVLGHAEDTHKDQYPEKRRVHAGPQFLDVVDTVASSKIT